MKRLYKNQQGILTLTLAIILLMAATSVTLYTVNNIVVEQITYKNQYNQEQAFEAAEAGIEYGIVDLNDDKSVIIDSNSDGYIDTNTTSVTLNNNATFNIVYSNPFQNNFDLIEITSTGTSIDGSTNKVTTQRLAKEAFIFYTPDLPLTVKDTVVLRGNTDIDSLTTTYSIWSGGAITYVGSSSSSSALGSSNKHGTGLDVAENDLNLTNLTSGSFFENFFGTSASQIQSNATIFYSYNTAHNYNAQLDGVAGKFIWLSQTSGKGTINSQTVIGTSTNPVIIVTDGDFKISGSAIINGILFMNSSIDDVSAGGAVINGLVIANGDYDSRGISTVDYDAAIVALAKSKTGRYVKVPGSWGND